jgi:aminoglycoside phosphotransferase (APT) family kinase protein
MKRNLALAARLPTVDEEALIRRHVGANCDIAYVDEGWDSRVYVVNGGEAVFKFPRTPAIKEQYQHEVAAFRLFEGIPTPVQLPRVRWAPADLAYLGYEGIVGISLSELLPLLSERDKQHIGAAIGGFLEQLHAADLPNVPERDVEGEIKRYFEKYALAAPALVDAFSRRELELIERFFLHELPTEMRRLGGEMRLCHVDLGPWNIIVTPDHQVGIIDFGDIGYEDPSSDFAGLCDDIVRDAALASHNADDWLRQKATLRAKAFPILDIPFYLGKKNEAGVQACISLLRRVVIEGEEGNARVRH